MPSKSSHSSSSSHLMRFIQGPSSSSSSRKHASKSSHKSEKTSDTRLVKASDQDAYYPETKSLWNEVKVTDGNPSTLILALVAPEQQKHMKKLIDDKIKHKKIRSAVMVTTPQQLQQQLDCAIKAGVKKTFKSLHLLVSSTISQLTYHIEDFVDQVFVKPCGSAGRQDALCIHPSSTYCGWKSYAWSHRSQESQLKKQLTHHEGCTFDMRYVPREELSFLHQLREQPGFSEAEKTNIIAQAEGLRHVSSDESHKDYTDSSADQVDNWFQKWKAFLATVMAAGAGAGGAAMTGGMWISRVGIMVKGPFGLSLAAGHTVFAAGGAGCAAGAGSAMVAYAAVYLIPWDRIWQMVISKLQPIWNAIKEAFFWIKDKLTELLNTVVTNVAWLVKERPVLA